MKTKIKKTKKSKYIQTHEFYNKIQKLIEDFERTINKTVKFNLEIKK